MAKAPEYMNFYEVAGGDGVPVADTSTTADPILNDAPKGDISQTDAELDAHIAEITGYPVAKTEDKTDDQATAGADSDTDKLEGDSDNGDAGKGDETGGSGSGVEPPVDVPVAKAPETPKEPEAPVTPTAYTLEVEDASGNKLTIGKIEDLPEDFEPKNNRQALQIISDLAKLDNKREADEAKSAETKAESDRQAAIAETNRGWQTEIDALVTDGRIDKPKLAQDDPKFLQDPAVVRMDAVFKFMTEENTARLAKGIAPIRSFTDALTHLELKEARQQKAADDKASTERAKAKAGLISGGGAGASAAGVADRPYFAGQAQEMSDLLR